MYHALAEGRSPISLAPAMFDWQMRWLYANQYRVLSLNEVVEALQNQTTLPERAVVITFDDGFESIYTHAFPTLSAYGFPATVFLVSDFCGGYNDWPGQPAFIPRYPLLNWPQIREMSQHGIEFGAHTRRHPRLDRLPSAQLLDEIEMGKRMIEDRLGQGIHFFAYPYGCYNHHTKALVSQLYTGACSTQLGMVDLQSDRFALPRIEVLYLNCSYLFQWLERALLFATYLTIRKQLRLLAARWRRE